MKEIVSKANVFLNMPEIIKCPCCGSDISHYDYHPRLNIDFDDIAKKIDDTSERFPTHIGDAIQIRLIISNEGDRIYGHPVIYKGVEDE